MLHKRWARPEAASAHEEDAVAAALGGAPWQQLSFYFPVGRVGLGDFSFLGLVDTTAIGFMAKA